MDWAMLSCYCVRRGGIWGRVGMVPPILNVRRRADQHCSRFPWHLSSEEEWGFRQSVLQAVRFRWELLIDAGVRRAFLSVPCALNCSPNRNICNLLGRVAHCRRRLASFLVCVTSNGYLGKTARLLWRVTPLLAARHSDSWRLGRAADETMASSIGLWYLERCVLCFDIV